MLATFVKQPPWTPTKVTATLETLTAALLRTPAPLNKNVLKMEVTSHVQLSNAPKLAIVLATLCTAQPLQVMPSKPVHNAMLKATVATDTHAPLLQVCAKPPTPNVILH